MENLHPKKIVEELDKYIVGQNEAKKVVSLALRSRWRRKQLDKDMQNDIFPKNIILMGPTGVGKTEIARRLSSISTAPFLKIEATKFTEVGYMGRDVESMIRDLVEIAINLVKSEKALKVEKRAATRARKRILDLLAGQPKKEDNKDIEEKDDQGRTRAFIEAKFEKGEFDEKEIEIEVQELRPMPKLEYFSNQGAEEIDMSFSDIFKGLLPKGKKKKRRIKVKEAFDIFCDEEQAKMISTEDVISEAKERVQNDGMVFVDEIDKIAGSYSKASGPDVSREGVQRDLLPLVEGTRVNTRYGVIDTAHILFIGAGAFNVSKPSDLIPELQGRFPLRVELHALTKKDFARILIEPKNALIKQYKALMGVENLKLEFTDDAIKELADSAFRLNQTSENIGARRLFTIMEFLLEEISFESPYKKGEKKKITAAFVRDRLEKFTNDEDLTNYIL
ncbi:ATP-dependent protease ATPase subunit HslU [bacterium]|nr:ATP-dependent protease ATPase subunit HslU [bacterium]